MTSNFLTGLANQIEQQYGVGQTQNNALNIMQNGNNAFNSTLGGFSQKIDPTEERRYLEDGFLRLDPYNVKPKGMEILLQEPDITVLVKKRAFSTLSENHRPDYMDTDERLFYKASKILFQNKCKQVAALEKLSKIERVSAEAGYLDSQLLPIIISLVDEVSPGFSNSPLAEENDFLDSTKSEPFKKLSGVIDKIRKIYSFSGSSIYTNWITDTSNIFKSDFSQGTGVIEITNVTNLSTHASTALGGGSFNLEIVDPYKAMVITNSDIEWALLDAMNMLNNSAIFQLGKSSLDKIAAQNIKILNDSRANRGAGPIEFIIDAGAPSRTKVSAILEGIGEAINFEYNPIPNLNTLLDNGGVTVSPESLKGGPIVGNEGLDPAHEVLFFSSIITALYNSIEFKQSSQTNIGQKNQSVNYARKKLRFHYGNKTIIQSMDQVHIYIGSKSRTDNRIMTGLQNMFTGLSFLQKLNNSVFDLKNQVTALFNPSQNIDMQLEKTIFVGRNFSTALWAMMRNLFINDKNGCHVFAGVVDQARRSFSDGRWVVSVAGSDNSVYLDYGVVTFKPGVDQFNGSLFDPLTPFQQNFDAVSSNFKNEKPKLLPENQALVGSQTSTSGLMRFKSGRNAGKPVTLDNFFEDKEISVNGIARDVYYAPNGLVYKWKEGIGVLVQFGDSFNANSISSMGIPQTENPLAGQDVMNVLSLYITGVPYNYATYYKIVSELDSLSRNPQSNASGAVSFYKTLTDNLKERNLMWGDFIPFKNLVVDEQTFMKVLDTQMTINNANSEIDQLLQQIQDTKNKLYLLQKGGDKTSRAAVSLQYDLKTLNQQISNQTKAVTETLSKSGLPMHLIGNDVSYDPSQLLDSQSFSLSDPKVRRELRRRVNFLTRRLSWQVRANDDKSFFIVDDSYDKDYDIIAFNKTLASQLSQYSSEYSSVKEKVQSVAQILNLEIFCDTQGHIRTRPQQYNRMPSSVFYRMLQLKQQTGIQIFPQFLEDLFADNIKSLFANLKVVEDQIRLDGAILGLTNDAAIVKFVQSPAITGFDNVDFHFVSDDDDGVITDISGIIDQSNPDTTTSAFNNTFVERLKSQNAVTSVFTVNKRATVIQDISASTSTLTTALSSVRISKLNTRLMQESGQQVNIDNFQLTSVNSVLASPTNAVDVFKVTKDLGDKLSARQQLIKQAAAAVKNAKEARSLDANDKTTANELLFPDLYGNQNIPEIFENMIEDETYDDYGPGSGGRYVIHNHQIISYDIRENRPEYTYIEVQGLLDPFLNSGTLPEGLNSFPEGGNGMVTAAAIDYDLWRMYGLMTRSSTHAPFLSNPQAQCAPYAASLLSRARRNILRGSIRIAGNEYMQPGEVVYIEDEDLLFYVEAVSHDFTYSGTSFITTLELSYGHNAGEYIPTPLDVIGKMLYNTTAPVGTSFINYRQSNVFNETPLGAIIINSGDPSIDGMLSGNHGTLNRDTISKIMYYGGAQINKNKVANSNIVPTIELRTFYDSKGSAPDNTLVTQTNNLMSILNGSASIDTQSPNTKLDSHISSDSMKPTQVDISKEGEYRSPSNQAYDLARNESNSTSTAPPEAITDAQQTQLTLFSVIIDVVMVFNNSDNSANTSAANNSSNPSATGGA